MLRHTVDVHTHDGATECALKHRALAFVSSVALREQEGRADDFVQRTNANRHVPQRACAHSVDVRELVSPLASVPRVSKGRLSPMGADDQRRIHAG